MRGSLQDRLLPFGLALLLGLTVPAFVTLVRVAGHYIPQPSIERDYAVGLVWAIVLFASILIWPAPARDKPALMIIWAAKCVVALGFMLFYEWSYNVDAFAHLYIAQQPKFPYAMPGFGDGTGLIHGVAWLHGRVIPDSYHAMKMSFAMAGLVGVYLIYRAVAAFGFERRSILLLLGLFPSILFWSTTLGKDPVQLLAVGLYVYGTLGFVRTGRLGYVLACTIGITISAAIRLWMGPILLLPLMVLLLIAMRSIAARILLISSAAGAGYVAVTMFAQKFGLESLQEVYALADGMGAGWEGGSGLSRTADLSSFGGMLRFAPYGMFTALLRPLPGEVMNPFGLLAGVENLVLLGLLIVGISRARISVMRQPVILWASSLVLCWGFVYGFVSVYNLGAAVRFKLQILPVLLLLAAYLAAGAPVRLDQSPPVESVPGRRRLNLSGSAPDPLRQRPL